MQICSSLFLTCFLPLACQCSLACVPLYDTLTPKAVEFIMNQRWVVYTHWHKHF